MTFSFPSEWSERKEHYKVLQNPCGNGFQIRSHIDHTDRRGETAQTSVFLYELFSVYPVSLPLQHNQCCTDLFWLRGGLTEVLF